MVNYVIINLNLNVQIRVVNFGRIRLPRSEIPGILIYPERGIPLIKYVRSKVPSSKDSVKSTYFFV